MLPNNPSELSPADRRRDVASVLARGTIRRPAAMPEPDH